MCSGEETMPQRILVIDDNDTARSVMADCLREEGYLVATAETASIGLDKCERTAFDLVVTDIVLPDRDGTSLIVELRKRFTGMRVVAVSGAPRTAFIDHLEMATKLGADHVLGKPFRTNDLRECVRNLLQTDLTT